MAYLTKPYLCRDCGVTDPAKFYGSSKTRCTLCHNKVRREHRADAALAGVHDLEDYRAQMKARTNNELLRRVWRVG